ncbi:protein adenylyltransferase SelO [Vibrio sp. WXL210]|uniref:protein adenylyltransferase SelO n=1 Tax=Vibrio sp. WXL210 TaxID=3450709 RepID=UPI003EC5F078
MDKDNLGDNEAINTINKLSHRFADMPGAFFTRIGVKPLSNSRWVIWNQDLAKQFDWPQTPPSGLLQRFLFGEQALEHHPALAMKYAGHQFGSYNPDLGDGRGLLLGELRDRDGRLHDLHLKGAGITPYSRMGDGRAVLRSTIREYLCSEALAGLGVPTTRALGMFTSDTPVYREKSEFGAMLLRTTPSHIRFGHFEHFYYLQQTDSQQTDHLRLLADKVIEWYWPECLDSEHPYLSMFIKIIDKTAALIAQWQGLGFTHGVMNTDNMSILGETFDFGPFGFMDGYNSQFIPNHSDYQGRYAFDMQPSVGLWNLSALGQALTPLIDKQHIEAELSHYQSKINHHYSEIIRSKLGLKSKQPEDAALISDLFSLLEQHHTDYTRFMRELSYLDHQDGTNVTELFVDSKASSSWLSRYLKRCKLETGQQGVTITDKERCKAMRKVNPKYILRNYLAQQAIVLAEQGDYSEVHRLAQLLKHPFDEQPELQHYANLPPTWAEDIEISCSS